MRRGIFSTTWRTEVRVDQTQGDTARRRSKLACVLIGLLAVLAHVPVCAASCQKENRSLRISSEHVVQLEGLLCKVTPTSRSPELRIEKYELSEAAAATLVTGSDAQAFLGPLRGGSLQENRVTEIYRDLVTRFGVDVRVGGPPQALHAHLEFGDSSSTLSGRATRTLRTLYGESDDMERYFPAIQEMESLDRKVIPNGMSFFYSAHCTEREQGRCKKYDPESVEQVFWRSLSSADVREYASRVARYNAALKKAKKTDPVVELDPPRSLRMFDYIAAGNWPEHFVVMTGEYNPVDSESCVIPGWVFRYRFPSVKVDVVVIENLSSASIRIDSILGSISRENGLRPYPGATAVDALRMQAAASLAPKAKLVVPVRLLMTSAETIADETISRAVYGKLGLNGNSGNASSHRVPDATKEFLFGPVLDISALIVNGDRLSLAAPPENQMTLTISSLGGSCPFLLHRGRNGEWVENGKILHKARGENNAEAESVSFSGLVKTFRIEEREPEVAYLRDARLLLRMASGATVELASDIFAGRTEPMSLWWGEGIDLTFALPPTLDPDSVVESVLTVSGYYVRYSDLKGRFYSVRDLVEGVGPAEQR